jgi:hypothetical protein
LCRALLQCGKSSPLSACNFFGRLRGLPLPDGLIGGAASKSCSKTLEPWPFAAVRTTVSGRPDASLSRWRLEPDLPRSVGLGPTF